MCDSVFGHICYCHSKGLYRIAPQESNLLYMGTMGEAPEVSRGPIRNQLYTLDRLRGKEKATGRWNCPLFNESPKGFPTHPAPLLENLRYTGLYEIGDNAS